MEEPKPIAKKTFHYPPLYQVAALFSTLLLGFIVVGSVIAEVEAIQNSRADAVLHLIGFVLGIALILWGLDFATRSITTTPEGLQVRWLLRRSVVPWPDVLEWRYLPLSLIHVRFRRGRGLYLWPLLENYLDLLNEIDVRRRENLLR